MTSLFITPFKKIECIRQETYIQNGAIMSDKTETTVCYKCTGCEKVFDHELDVGKHILNAHMMRGISYNQSWYNNWYYNKFDGTSSKHCEYVCDLCRTQVCSRRNADYSDIARHIKMHSFFNIDFADGYSRSFECKRCKFNFNCRDIDEFFTRMNSHFDTHLPIYKSAIAFMCCVKKTCTIPMFDAQRIGKLMVGMPM